MRSLVSKKQTNDLNALRKELEKDTLIKNDGIESHNPLVKERKSVLSDHVTIKSNKPKV